MENKDKICSLCGLEFSTISSKNRHLRSIHELNTTPTSKSHIICPLCEKNEKICGTYKKLENHLALEHDIKLEFETHHFIDNQSYEHWFETEKLEMVYAVHGVKKYKDYTLKSYICNRSNSKGFESKSSQRMKKPGSSIKINGVCPSRIETKILQTGHTLSRIWKTHVGHEEETRNQHLSKIDKKQIVQKLCDGVAVERIISDARKGKSEKLDRLSLLHRKDIAYLSKKHNILERKQEQRLGSDSVLDEAAIQFSLEKPLEIEIAHCEEIEGFMEMNRCENDSTDMLDRKAIRKAKLEAVNNYLKSLDDEEFDRCVDQIMEMAEEDKAFTEKKLDKQEFFASKKNE